MLRTQGFSKGRDLFSNRILESRKCGYDTHNSSMESKGTREADTSEVQWRLNLFWETFLGFQPSVPSAGSHGFQRKGFHFQ